jgi:hypothetical protein
MIYKKGHISVILHVEYKAGGSHGDALLSLPLIKKQKSSRRSTQAGIRLYVPCMSAYICLPLVMVAESTAKLHCKTSP